MMEETSFALCIEPVWICSVCPDVAKLWLGAYSEEERFWERAPYASAKVAKLLL